MKDWEQGVRSNQNLQARYAYYRRCQVVMGSGEQCRCPALKGGEICRNHAEQKRVLERRLGQQVEVLSRAADKLAKSTGRKDVIEDLFESRRGIQLALDEAMHAIVEDRIDEKAARELLRELERATARIKISPLINSDDDGEIAVIARNRKRKCKTEARRRGDTEEIR
jgi:hypothetical protein